jgi:pimeloyl-ACP methyl ester carboxylesterase
MTAQNVTDDLYWLLDKANIRTPVVLVAHSLGGLYATLYADRFPSQLAGLVLIDPSFAGQDMGETAEEQRRSEKLFAESQTELARCADLLRQGKLSRANPGGCFQPAPGRTTVEIDYLAQQFFKPFRWEAMLSESRNLHAAGAFSEDEQQEQRVARPFGDKPVIVLTAGIAPKQPDETDEEHRKNLAHWKAGHDQLAARSTRGESILVSDSTHMIQTDRPQAVVDAIRKVVLAVRRPKAAAH